MKFPEKICEILLKFHNLGGMLGRNFAHFQNTIVDKEVFEFHMKYKWLPDDCTNICMNCNVLFSQFIRKHHCKFLLKIIIYL